MSEHEKVQQEDDPETQFRCIQNEYEAHIAALKGGDSNVLPLVTKYENVFHTLKRFYHENKRLREKEVDHQSLSKVNRKSSDDAWSLVIAGQKKEEAISSKVSQLHDQLTKLSTQLQEERNNNIKQDGQFKEIIKDRDQLKEKITQLLDQVKQTEITSRDLQSRNVALETKVETLRTKNVELLDVLNEKDVLMNKNDNTCKELEKELFELRDKFGRKSEENVDLKLSSAVMKKQVDNLSKDLRDAKKKLEDQTLTIEELRQKSNQLSEQVSSQRNEITLMTVDSRKASKELQIAKSLERKIATEKSQLQRKLDSEHKEILKLQQSIENERSQNRASRQEIHILQMNLDKMKESEQISRRQLSTLERELNIYVEKIHRMEQLMKQAGEEACHQEHTILSLEKQSISTKDQIDHLQKTIQSSDKVREKQNDEISNHMKSLEIAQNEIVVRNAEIEELKKEIRLKDCNLRDQDHTSNRLRADKGKVIRELSEERQNNQNLMKEINVLRMELKNLRNEIISKDTVLVKSYYEKKNESTRKDQLINEVAILRRHVCDRDEAIQKQGLEIHNLNTSLKQADECVGTQKSEYDQLINERDMLSMQLTRKNEELVLLHEKVKTQSNTLKNGEIQYQQRIEELRHLKIKLQDLQRELDSIKGGNTIDINGMNKELMQKDKELLHEKVKVKALSDELLYPLNVHRWRKLEGSDPATFELVQKNETLQKRLIKKAEEVIEKVAEIQEKEEEIASLKKQLSRKPGSELLDRLKSKENEVREKARQMKAMAGELNMNQAQVHEYKKEIHRLNHDLNDLKHKFFIQKKKEVVAKEKEFQWLAESGLVSLENAYREGIERIAEERESVNNNQQNYHRVKFVGGGFAVK